MLMAQSEAETASVIARAMPTSARPRSSAFFVLAVLTLANTLNYLDRNIISILAEAIKADLHITDAQIGFLYGTIFAALYAVFGLPIGRLADRVNQAKLVGAGLTLWSAMTAASALARNFASLALARVGVSVGEATANPCSHALLGEYFPPQRRSSAYAVYLTSTFIGMGCSLVIGGYVLRHWDRIGDALGIAFMRPWQAAFMLCGLPGLLLALLVLRIRNPHPVHHERRVAFARFVSETAAVIPPFSLFQLRGAALRLNLLIAVAVVLAAALLGRLTGDWTQWTALALTLYAMITFAQMLWRRDRPLFALTFGTRSFTLLVSGMSLVAGIHNALLFWATPYLLRTFGVAPDVAGQTMGLIIIFAGSAGVLAGGVAADYIRRHDLRAAIWLTLGALFMAAPFGIAMFVTADRMVFYVCFTAFALLQNCWAGSAAAAVQELVLPRMRATGGATFSLIIIVSNFALGPYLVGKISTLTGSLSTGALTMYCLAPFAILLLLLAIRTVKPDVESREARAAALGEAMTHVD